MAQKVRRHVAGEEPVSDLADECGVQPSQVHFYVKQVLDRAEKALSPSSSPFVRKSLIRGSWQALGRPVRIWRWREL
jgi:hypothetical protein